MFRVSCHYPSKKSTVQGLEQRIPKRPQLIYPNRLNHIKALGTPWSKEIVKMRNSSTGPCPSSQAYYSSFQGPWNTVSRVFSHWMPPCSAWFSRLLHPTSDCQTALCHSWNSIALEWTSGSTSSGDDPPVCAIRCLLVIEYCQRFSRRGRPEGHGVHHHGNCGEEFDRPTMCMTILLRSLSLYPQRKSCWMVLA